MRKVVVSFYGILALLSLVFLSSPCTMAQQQPNRTIEIGVLSTTHVLFTSDLTYVDISSPDVIVAKVVDASKNMLALKARKEFAFTTTVSALETNGTMHTFYVRFNASPAELVIDTRTPVGAVSGSVNTQIRPIVDVPVVNADSQDSSQSVSTTKKSGKKKGIDKQSSNNHRTGVSVTSAQSSNFGRSNAPTIEEVLHRSRELYHVIDKVYGLEAAVVNIYAYSELTYLVIELRNNSDIGYESGEAQFMVEGKEDEKTKILTSKEIWSKSSFGTLSCPPKSSTRIGYSIPKLTLQKNEVLNIYIYEKNGARNLFLKLNDKDVNYAKSPVKN